MSGRLAGLKDDLKAERQPAEGIGGGHRQHAGEGANRQAGARGVLHPELSRTLNMMATERDA